MTDRLCIELSSADAAPARLELPVGQATAMLCQLAALNLSATLYALHQRNPRTDAEPGLARHALQLARRGEEQECRACAAEALRLSEQSRTPRDAARSLAALGELELALGNAAKAARQFERQQQLLAEHKIDDLGLSPAAELVDAYLKLGRFDKARPIAGNFTAAALATGQLWSLARALRCQGQLAEDRKLATYFERALSHHAMTSDVFETARTRLAYGERLRRARQRVLAREQLRAALDTFTRLDARPWAERARAELAASGETLRRRDPTTIDELTAQELQIALLLASGKTTKQAAAAMFLSPKTIEYHLRHVYQKLAINSRQQLAQTLQPSFASGANDTSITLRDRIPRCLSA